MTDVDILARQLEAEMREAVWAWDAGPWHEAQKGRAA